MKVSYPGLAIICCFAVSGADMARGDPLYEGIVATRNSLASQGLTGGPTTVMGRTAHVATENLTSIKIAFGNFYVVGGGSTRDYGLGAAARITASIEYPAGTCTQLKFSGQVSTVIPDVSAAFSDYTAVSIPVGATFWIREYWKNPSGVILNFFQNEALQEALVANGPDQTKTCDAISKGTAWSLPTLAVIGHTTNPSIIIVGDSVCSARNDAPATTGIDAYDGKVGVVARSLGSLPFLNLCVGGEAATTWIADGSARNMLIPFGSDLISNLGRNDFYVHGRTVQQTEAALQSVYALARTGQKIWQTTITPNTTSANGWLSPNDQIQMNLSWTGYRNKLNFDIRAGLPHVFGYFDVAKAIGFGANNQDWIVSPAPPYSEDGIHPNVAGYKFIQNSHIIRQDSFERP